MKIKENIWLDIEEYLDDTMEPEKLIDFENKLTSDPELRKELDFAWKLRRAVQQKEIDKFKKQHLEPNFWDRFLKDKFYVLGTVLAIVIIASISINIFNQKEIPAPPKAPVPSSSDSIKRIIPDIAQQSEIITDPIANILDSEELFAMAETNINRYSDMDFQTNTTRANKNNTELDTLSLARIAFNNKDWLESIRLFNRVKNLNEYSADYASLGYSYLKNENIKNSIQIFGKLKESSLLPEWRAKGQWYLLMAYLVAGEPYQKEFRETLESALDQKDNDPESKSRYRKLEREYINLKKQRKTNTE